MARRGRRRPLRREARPGSYTAPKTIVLRGQKELRDELVIPRYLGYVYSMVVPSKLLYIGALTLPQ